MSGTRHIVFAVAGYAAIGMGHVYRALMLAREFPGCRVSLCFSRDSESSALNLAAGRYPCHIQWHPELAPDILALAPDMVVNDLLDTDRAYMAALKAAGLPVINFEDLGPGAELADLVVNALYERADGDDARLLCGHRYFCLRDEFLMAEPNKFRPEAGRLLLTFGGADPKDYTRLCLDLLYPECRRLGLFLSIVAGPGYAHKADLARRIAFLDPQGSRIAYTDVSNVMSAAMQGVDAAVCSAGRTVYELAHMRIPALVLAQHEREESHGFAEEATGFLPLGVAGAADPEQILGTFQRLMAPEKRLALHKAASRLDFRANKARVVARMAALL
ncbi:hypothetical protein LJC15_05980 [Desulfovibrio sp. OttesenSCG-928-G11]|nr:hypothetical protein [Desulfovibrio sp. OttesenSCG-928-G11]